VPYLQVGHELGHHGGVRGGRLEPLHPDLHVTQGIFGGVLRRNY
jgi:hypothetical protein